MTSRFVRVIGQVLDIDTSVVLVGVDYDTVSITGSVRLSQEQADQFAQLFVRACWEAARCHQCDCPPEYAHPEVPDGV